MDRVYLFAGAGLFALAFWLTFGWAGTVIAGLIFAGAVLIGKALYE